MLDTSPYYEPIGDGLGMHEIDDQCEWCGTHYGAAMLRSRHSPPLYCYVTMPLPDGERCSIRVCIGECEAEARAAAKRARAEIGGGQ